MSWEEDLENIDFDDANFDDMLAELDMEVITGGSTMNQVGDVQVPPEAAAACHCQDR